MIYGSFIMPEFCLYFFLSTFCKTIIKNRSIVNRTFGVPCPNCGNTATRAYFTSQEAKYHNCPQNQVIQVECPYCDYLMVMCAFSGNVVEAHASSTSLLTNKRNLSQLSVST